MTQPGDTHNPEIATSNPAFVVQRRGTDLHVGRRSDQTVLWQDETVPVAELPEQARQALDAGELDAMPLTLALDAIVEAYVNRGG